MAHEDNWSWSTTVAFQPWPPDSGQMSAVFGQVGFPATENWLPGNLYRHGLQVSRGFGCSVGELRVTVYVGPNQYVIGCYPELTANDLEVREVPGFLQFLLNGEVVYAAGPPFNRLYDIPPGFTIIGDAATWEWSDPIRVVDFSPPVWKSNGSILYDGLPYTDWYFGIGYDGGVEWNQPEFLCTITSQFGWGFFRQLFRSIPPLPPTPVAYRPGLAALYDRGTHNTFLLYCAPPGIAQKRGFYQTSPADLTTSIFSAGTADAATAIIPAGGTKFAFFSRYLANYVESTDNDGLDSNVDGVADWDMMEINKWRDYSLLDVAPSMDCRRAFAVLGYGGGSLYLSRYNQGDPATEANWTDPALIVTGLAGTAVARIVDYGSRLVCYYQVGTAAVQALENYDDGTSATWV